MKRSKRRALVLYSLTLLTLVGTAARGGGAHAASTSSNKIAPWLQSQLQSGGKRDVFILMASSADLAAADGMDARNARARFVYDTLREEAETQTPLVEWLRSKGYDATRFWIINAVLVRGADADLVDRLAQRSDVGRLVGNPVVNGLEGVMVADTAMSATVAPGSRAAAPFAGSLSKSFPKSFPTRPGKGRARRSAFRLPGSEPSAADITKRATSGSSAADVRELINRDSSSYPAPSAKAPLVQSTATPSPASGLASMTASDGHGSVATAWVPRSTNAIECGIGAVNADDVWIQTGLRGEGIVVGTMDTGVEWTHPALQGHYRGWDGATADHSYSWHDAIQPTAAPLDDNNHGTHVTGTMVGDDGGANQIGVAPGAKWVGCRNMDHGNGTPATYLDCIQWGLAPYPLGGDPFKDGRPDLAPDITNNSWSCPPSEGCDPFSLQQAFENVRAAGQMTVGAAQNAGPNCSTVTSPLGLYDAVFTAGAVDCAGALAGFSSRGPITVDGSNRMKPNVAAPGVNVRSSVRGGQYASLNGTSMATPHTAGVMALLWSVKPNLRHLIGISRCYLEQSATTATLPTGVPQTCGGTTAATHPNNFWGWGKIDALGAVNLGPDGDTDGIADACDCAPADTGAFDAPPEISGARFTDPSTMEWQSLAAISGTGTTYDVVRGLVSQLRASAGFADAVCLSNDQTSASYTDIDLPNPDDAFYYLVRGQNGCGTGAWGRGLLGAQRVITICP